MSDREKASEFETRMNVVSDKVISQWHNQGNWITNIVKQSLEAGIQHFFGIKNGITYVDSFL